KIGAGLRVGKMRIFVDPGTDDGLCPVRHALHSLEWRVAVPVGPAGNDQGRNRKTLEILADGTVTPEIVAALMTQPFLHEEGFLIESLQPHFPPPLADKFRV